MRERENGSERQNEREKERGRKGEKQRRATKQQKYPGKDASYNYDGQTTLYKNVSQVLLLTFLPCFADNQTELLKKKKRKIESKFSSQLFSVSRTELFTQGGDKTHQTKTCKSRAGPTVPRGKLHIHLSGCFFLSLFWD